ncbi:PhnA domain-containing protein [Acinetobacter baumannii]|uniref:PhnA domain-containing protein n=1 Tax=Acinetobacter baumannii TaxID=470 RepID=UPI0039A6F8D1
MFKSLITVTLSPSAKTFPLASLITSCSSVVKVGTKVKSIRLVPDASDGHNIDCKIDGIGQMKLKSEFVKKA